MAKKIDATISFLFTQTLLVFSADSRLWKTLYMDERDNCPITIRNKHMNEGDFYIIKSDAFEGYKQTNTSKPIDCINDFNYNNRKIAIRLLQWSCDQKFREPYLAIYDSCNGYHEHLMVIYNCSHSTPLFVRSSGSCVRIYHYRGHQEHGYYFIIQAIALEDIQSFPLGGVIAIGITSFIVFTFLMKVLCIIIGWEKSFPLNNDDDTKLIPDDDSGGEIEKKHVIVYDDSYSESEIADFCQTLLFDETDDKKEEVTYFIKETEHLDNKQYCALSDINKEEQTEMKFLYRDATFNSAKQFVL